MAIVESSHRQSPRGAREQYEDVLPEHISEPPDFGLALFDLEDETAGGVCYSTKGGYKRFRSRGDLANSTIWISNLKHINQAMHNVRNESFLGSKLDAIAADGGWELAGYRRVGDIDKGGMVDIADLFDRTRAVILAAYPWKDTDSDWKYGRLSEAITEIILPRSRLSEDRAPAQLAPALKGAYQGYSSPPKSPQTYDEGSRVITFRRNRVIHALDVLRMPLPHTGWVYSRQPRAMRDYLRSERPALINVSIEWRNATPDVVDVIAFGSDIGKQAIRRWVTQAELIWLLEYARIEPLADYMPNAAQAVHSSLQLPAIVGGDFTYWLSLANGLVAEAHWKGLATPRWDPRSRKVEDSVTSVYLRAMDRAICAQIALKAHAKGLLVMGYGSGAVTLRVPNMSIEDLADLAAELELHHPCLAAEAVARERSDSQ